MNGKKRWIIIVAVTGIVVAFLSLLLTAQRLNKTKMDTGETRKKVELSYHRSIPETAQTARGKKMLAAAERFSRTSYVASVWVVDLKGEIVFRQGGPGKIGDNVKTLASGVEMDRVLGSLPEGVLSPEAQLQLLTVAALRSEGEHNDVFRHLVRPVLNDKGKQIALVAVAYDVSPSVGGPFRAVDVIPTLLVFLGFSVYWLGLTLWVWFDARHRGEVAALWGLFILLTNLVGLLAYLIAIKGPAAPPKKVRLPVS